MTTPAAGWEHLKRDEHDRVWDRFYEKFRFRPSVNPANWPAIAEPVPSLTWDIDVNRVDVDEDRLNRLVMGALRDCLSEQDWVYVLDWQHPGYRCWPHRVDLSRRMEDWPVEVFPNGDYYIFVSQDLRMGTFGHPWEASLCVWGAELIDAVAARDATVLTHLCRRDGKPVGRP